MDPTSARDPLQIEDAVTPHPTERALWPGTEPEDSRPEPVAAGAATAGAAGGLVASLPIIGPALASVCASCIGLGGAALAGAVLAWATPAAFAIGGIIAALGVRRNLKQARESCSVTQYRRARRIALATLFIVAAASFALSAFVIRPLLGDLGERIGGGERVLP